VTARRALLLLAALAAIAAAPACAAAPDSLAGTVAIAPPESALQSLTDAFAAGSVTALDSLLAADFAFFTPGQRPAPRLPGRVERAAELAVAADLFDAPATDSLLLRVGVVVQGVDPEHADSTRHYRVLAAQRFACDVHMSGRLLRGKPSLNVFHVVRGDVALLAPGQPADSTRWYLRLWLEDADRIATALAGVRGDCALDEQQAPEPEPPADTTSAAAAGFERSWVDSSLVVADSTGADSTSADLTVAADDSTLAEADSSLALGGSARVPGEDEDFGTAGADSTSVAAADSVEAAPSPPPPTALAVEPLGAPSCPGLDVRCDLPAGEPARLEVYDVTGRRLQRVEMGVRAAASLRVRAGAGVALAPGLYWLRLTQGAQSVTRMVAVGR
jgi:hypothetical protein